MLYRHVQPLFLSAEFSADRQRSPKMRVRPLDAEASDDQIRFLFWASVGERAAASHVGPSTPAPTPGRPKLFIEMSPDGEGWVVQSTLDVRERPYLVTVPHMLTYVRVRLEPDGVEAQAYALVLGNAPFQLDGSSPLLRNRNPSPGKAP